MIILKGLGFRTLRAKTLEVKRIVIAWIKINFKVRQKRSFQFVLININEEMVHIGGSVFQKWESLIK